jgi:hypothetical protein
LSPFDSTRLGRVGMLTARNRELGMGINRSSVNRSMSEGEPVNRSVNRLIDQNSGKHASLCIEDVR